MPQTATAGPAIGVQGRDVLCVITAIPGGSENTQKQRVSDLRLHLSAFRGKCNCKAGPSIIAIKDGAVKCSCRGVLPGGMVAN